MGRRVGEEEWGEWLGRRVGGGTGKREEEEGWDADWGGDDGEKVWNQKWKMDWETNMREDRWGGGMWRRGKLGKTEEQGTWLAV